MVAYFWLLICHTECSVVFQSISNFSKNYISTNNSKYILLVLFLNVTSFSFFRDKTRYRSRSRDRGGDHRRGGVASIGLHDPMPKHRDGRDRDRDRVSSYDRKSREYRR